MLKPLGVNILDDQAPPCLKQAQNFIFLFLMTATQNSETSYRI